jgi:predicted SnoaL-like aldol condensation-catalyzing enzyme
MKKMKSFQPISVALILTIVFVACSGGSSDKEAAGSTDTAMAAPASTMSSADANQEKLEANKKLVTDFIQTLYGDKDSAAIDKYIADNIKEHNPILQDGKEWLKNAVRPFLTNPNIEKSKVEIKQIAAEGDMVWVLRREVAPNGKVFARAEIYRIENDKIAENWLITETEPKTSANKNTMF